MDFTTSRTPYVALTPDQSTFDSDIPLAHFDVSEPDSASRRPTGSVNNQRSFQNSLTTKWRKFFSKCNMTCENNIGLLLITVSGAFASMMNTLVKKLNSIDPPVPILELILVRMLMTGAASLLYMWITNVPDPLLGPKGVRGLLALRGVLGFFGIAGLYFSLQYLSVSDATVLQFLVPMCTGILGALVLQEHFARDQAFASLLSLAGVVLIARPASLFGHTVSNPQAETVRNIPAVLEGRSDYMEATPTQRLGAVGFGLVGVFGATGAYTTIRAVGKRAHALHSVVSYTVQCTVVSVVLMLALRTPIVLPTRLDWIGMFLAIGICGFIYQVLFAMGLQRETAGRGTMAVYVQVVYATILDTVFFHSTPNLPSVIGTSIITSCAIYIAISKKNPDERKRQQSLLSSQGADHSLEEGLLDYQDQNIEPPESKDDDMTISTNPIERPELSFEGLTNDEDAPHAS
ncbi:DUF6-domain-containing protein [Daedalea quercina L-15889]|uniref:DUF6-domain-containing protein n=1 Tax=Daedalea quercina L-15889 TaxID=1314783 RepID=A0A165MI43_9APHY|nr:DUF6-domain-containing protein [Daedalea quercina L-15889]